MSLGVIMHEIDEVQVREHQHSEELGMIGFF